MVHYVVGGKNKSTAWCPFFLLLLFKRRFKSSGVTRGLEMNRKLIELGMGED